MGMLLLLGNRNRKFMHADEASIFVVLSISMVQPFCGFAGKTLSSSRLFKGLVEFTAHLIFPIPCSVNLPSMYVLIYNRSLFDLVLYPQAREMGLEQVPSSRSISPRPLDAVYKNIDQISCGCSSFISKLNFLLSSSI